MKIQYAKLGLFVLFIALIASQFVLAVEFNQTISAQDKATFDQILQPVEDEIYVNITSGRKTQALGLLFAAYARHSKVKKIAYNPEENKDTVVYLPRISFRLNESQKKILTYLVSKPGKSISDLAKEIDISTAMLYRTLNELKDMDMVTMEKGIHITDAGKIARL